MKPWAPRPAQWAACSQQLRFYKRNRPEPERNRWKLQGKRPTHETEPDGTGGGTGPFPQKLQAKRPFSVAGYSFF